MVATPACIASVLLATVAHVLASEVVTYPAVGYSPQYFSFDDYEALIIDESADATTYTIVCPSTSTACLSAPGATQTVIAGPSTFVFDFAETGRSDAIKTRWDCTFTGAPTATTASCLFSRRNPILESYQSTMFPPTTFLVPAPTGQTVFEYYEVQYASMTVVGSFKDAAVPTVTSGGGGGSLMTLAPTVGGWGADGTGVAGRRCVDGVVAGVSLAAVVWSLL